MSAAYLRNVVSFLLDGVEYYHRGSARCATIEEVSDTLMGIPSMHALARAAGAPSLLEVTPTAWLAGSPLMRALRRELARREDDQEPPTG